jgi:H+/gluconate symporter-like permease
MNNKFLIMIIICIIYIILCIYTDYPTEDKKLSDDKKRLLVLTNIYGYILGIYILIFEREYIYDNYNNNINARLIEFIIILFLMCFGIYASIFQNNANSNLGKISSSIAPLLPSFFIILILCLNTIITILRNKNDNINNEFNEITGLII